MDSKEHETACELGMARVRQRPGRGKLLRAQTYAFGTTAAVAAQKDESKKAAACSAATLMPMLDLEAMDVEMTQPLHVDQSALHAGDPYGGWLQLPSTRRMDSF